MNYPIVNNFDPVRYSGIWYEIAKTLFPEPYQMRNCENASAEYRLLSDNSIEIINYCIKDNKEIGYAKGYGIIRDYENNENNKGILDIQFNEFNILGQEFPVDDKGEYIIFWTDYDNFSIVGSPNLSNKMIWVLSRKPKIERGYIPSIKNFISELGYDLNKVYLDKNVLI